ncbi:hypothetical protein BC833DRAFT_622621 [Globomyces pollinis-pini]|nr:hypothetical protein BC833DRAFT_622621 [Globomyces pollinis-pini]KAJ2997776.1 hypothetical protein HDV02_005145 [Globomyces sp. JEL0801]
MDQLPSAIESRRSSIPSLKTRTSDYLGSHETVAIDEGKNDIIIQKLLQNRPQMTDVNEDDERERQRRMYNMLRHSNHYKKLQVEMANDSWNVYISNLSNSSCDVHDNRFLNVEDLDAALQCDSDNESNRNGSKTDKPTILKHVKSKGASFGLLDESDLDEALELSLDTIGEDTALKTNITFNHPKNPTTKRTRKVSFSITNDDTFDHKSTNSDEPGDPTNQQGFLKLPKDGTSVKSNERRFTPSALTQAFKKLLMKEKDI